MNAALKKRKTRVVLIDDDPAFSQVLSLAATKFNWIVTCFQSFEEADGLTLKAADVLVLDYNLGDSNGIDIAKRLARRRIHAQILLVSSNQDALTRVDWPQNIGHFVSKAVGPFGLIDSIHQLLHLQQLRLA